MGIDCRSVLSQKGALADCMDSFTARPQQQDMAETIADGIENNKSLICEAGTGMGKTFAYLVPALAFGKRVIISTATKHLQDQLYHKDIPIIQKALARPTKTAVLKGRANYLCLHRLEHSEEGSEHFDNHDVSDLQMVKKWSNITNTGDLAELADLPEDTKLLPQIVSNSENCLGKKCDTYEDCFVFKARRKAYKAEIIVVNHHLLLADLALRGADSGELLSKADTIIFDEAHQLPALASEFFSEIISSRQCIDFFNDTHTAYLADANDMPQLLEAIDACQISLQHLRANFTVENKRIAWEQVIADKKVQQALQDFTDCLTNIEKCLSNLAGRSNQLDNCCGRVKHMLVMLQNMISQESQELIRWLETRGQGFMLYQTPLDISAIFQARLAEHECNSIYISATLSVAGDFSHFISQLALTDIATQFWESPFDYQKQALLYLPKAMPEPSDQQYTEAFATAVLPVIKASQGHTFLLFTSHAAMRKAHTLLCDKLSYPLFLQGNAPRSELLESFRNTKNAVLFGTSSFWQGVDVKGSALSCVIIDKLPFAPPNDPVFQARAEKIKQQGQDPFLSYQIPQAVITLKQGIGRLLRDISDYGVLMICDPRLKSKSYGKHFLASLPDMPQSTEITDVEKFFATKLTTKHGAETSQ